MQYRMPGFDRKYVFSDYHDKRKWMVMPHMKCSPIFFQLGLWGGEEGKREIHEGETVCQGDFEILSGFKS